MPCRKSAWLGQFLLATLCCAIGPRSASADWTLTLFLGAARTADSRLALMQPADMTAVTLSPVHFDSESFEPPLYYGYRAGFFPRSHGTAMRSVTRPLYWLFDRIAGPARGARQEKLAAGDGTLQGDQATSSRGWLGIEGELVHLKVVADTARSVGVAGQVQGLAVSGSRPMASVIERFSITHGVNLLLVNLVARREGGALAHRLRQGSGGQVEGVPRWMITGRFGMGASIPHAESTVRGVSVEGYEWGGFSLQGAAGVEVRVAGPFYLTGEYKLTRTSQDVIIVGGRAQATLTTHHAVWGLVVHVGR